MNVNAKQKIFAARRRRPGSRLAGRVVLVALALMILGGVLSACGGAPAPKLTHQSIAIPADQASDHGVTEGQLNRLAEAVEATASPFVLREQLVAALRGYDTSAAGFDDGNLPEAQPEKAAEFALNALDRSGIDRDSYAGLNVKDLETLVASYATAVEVEAQRNFLGTLMYWIGVAFGWMINVLGFGSFILGALFFALFVEIIMLPISILQQKNARKQAALRPKEMAIRSKYAGRTDAKTQQQITTEIQELYTKEGYSPMTSGCLPLLISMPVVMVLYYVVIDPLQYILGCSSGLSAALTTFASTSRAAGGLGLTLQSTRGSIEILAQLKDSVDLEGLRDFLFFTNGDACYEAIHSVQGSIPNFSLFGLNFGMIPSISSPSWLLLIPVLTFVVYYASMKINRKFTYQPTMAAGKDAASGCSNHIMDISMPLISVWITFIVPAAVGLYWIFKSVLGCVKQIIMSFVMPLPTFTEEDYKAAAREMAGKDKKPRKKSGGGNPNVRSLHHIDDEDYETPSLPNAGATTKTKKKHEGDSGRRADTPAEASPDAKTQEPDASHESENENEKEKSVDRGALTVEKAPLKEDRPQDR